MLDLSFLVYLCASPTHPLPWIHSRDKPPSSCWKLSPDIQRSSRRQGLYIVQTLKVFSSVHPSPDYRTRRSCNIRQMRSVMIPTEDYYRDNSRRMQRHDEGLRIAVIWQREVAMLRWSRWHDCKVIVRAMINYKLATSSRLLSFLSFLIIITFRLFSW